MAGQEAHAFVVRTRSESEDFVRAELGAIERFEDRIQVSIMANCNNMSTPCRMSAASMLDRRSLSYGMSSPML